MRCTTVGSSVHSGSRSDTASPRLPAADFRRKTARGNAGDGINWYSYCGNDPVNRIDLWGLEWVLNQPFGGRNNHHGEDWIYRDDQTGEIITSGVPVPSPVSGTVVGSGYTEDMGNYIQIQDDTGMILSVQHGSEKNPYAFGEFNNGDQVNIGDIVSIAGNTGNSTGPHVHVDYGTRNIPLDTSGGIVKEWGAYYVDPPDLDAVQSTEFSAWEDSRYGDQGQWFEVNRTPTSGYKNNSCVQ